MKELVLSLHKNSENNIEVKQMCDFKVFDSYLIQVIDKHLSLWNEALKFDLL